VSHPPHDPSPPYWAGEGRSAHLLVSLERVDGGADWKGLIRHYFDEWILAAVTFLALKGTAEFTSEVGKNSVL